MIPALGKRTTSARTRAIARKIFKNELVARVDPRWGLGDISLLGKKLPGGVIRTLSLTILY